ncbi:hypothetical protein VTK73DRAFT_9279 [Phialemonium thermophilum]|uniref:ribonuclease H n=1 Tax=Phialemonium thermophilum TaxID=223376 RepID=A0ABR3W3N3_9PEZI
MPLGWYLAQGLYPLEPASSDDEEGPCTLPNGRTVCGPHGLVVCGKCCTDYSFMDEVDGSDGEDDEDEDDDEDDEYGDWGHGHRLGYLESPSVSLFGMASVPRPAPTRFGGGTSRETGQVLPTKYSPRRPVHPMELFPNQRNSMGFGRFIHSCDPSSFLVFTDGACLNNGQQNPRAGWAFVFGMRGGQPIVASGRLEKKGPFGDDGAQTSNRAELRAVIAALRFRYWPGEASGAGGHRFFTTLTIATDSEYVVEGCTTWVANWIRRDWKTAGNTNVKNKDLWQSLLGEVESLAAGGLSVRFWRIPREWNEMADEAAKRAAASNDVADQWRDVLGTMC